ncbi:chemotaxis protein CheA [Granulicella sibirica]|uniref:histidine kinase n=1 Tax=Granulicella sibirica TaxID=2479048 RepID=A0A4Q0TA31_9BACT|nr:chemotaxis protein CheA [Granulicella sibirica]RXH58626.1 Signal transduction histidine kinase CheA [Granulicella sibirica]
MRKAGRQANREDAEDAKEPPIRQQAEGSIVQAVPGAETASIAGASLNDQIDEISTRLIIDGVQSLDPADFRRFGDAAATNGCQQAASLARSLADRIAPPATLSVPERTGLLSSGLVELRRLIDHRDAIVPAPVAPVPASSTVLPPETNSLAADEDLILEFITESTEHLVTIESQMLLLEKDSAESETLNAVFRGFHTIKGLAGFLEFTAIQSLAHEVETVLDLARNGQLAVTPSVVDAVLESTDVVRRELDGISKRLAGKAFPPSGVTEDLLGRIRRVAAAQSAAVSPPSPSEPSPAAPPSVPQNQPATAALPIPVQRKGHPVEVSPASSVPTEAFRGGDSTVRIDTAKLDQLMDMVGEMVIAQTLIGHSPALTSVQDTRFLRDLTQLARITSDVQRITTGMRMVPIGMQFQKTARLIRDLSRRAGKQIVLETAGEDTELDKSIAEELSDPLLHMVRNSIDHGIEPPEERAALGKDPTATIRIAAYHQSGQIVVAISDDGRGLNREKILAKAQQNGLIQPGHQLTDSEIFLLIFEAGFSTAEKVTDISGRGVGMDVVRKHVQKLRGRIDIHSKAGEGTTFYIKLPLTLAIIEGLVVVVGNHRYVVPIYSVREMFRPRTEMLSTVQGSGEMAMVRGSLMPVIRLHRRFGLDPRSTNLTDGMLVVAETEGKQFCIFIDELIGKQEVVIKSLGPSFKHVVGVAGCAILGDGRVGLILDVDGIYKGKP